MNGKKVAAHLSKLNIMQTALLHSVNWLEAVYDGAVCVMDVDMMTGAVDLYGHPVKNKQFRTDLSAMLAGVFNRNYGTAGGYFFGSEP